MARYWAHENRCGVKIIVGSYKRPTSIPGVMMEKPIVKTCQFGAPNTQLNMYSTVDPIEMTALEQHAMYGGIMGMGEGGNFVSGVSHLFFKLAENTPRPVSALELNKSLHKEVSFREGLLAKAVKMGVRGELGAMKNSEIQALIDKQFEEVKKMMTTEKELPEFPEAKEMLEVPTLPKTVKKKGGRPRKINTEDLVISAEV